MPSTFPPLQNLPLAEKQGPDPGDADATIQPFTGKFSAVTLSGPLTGNRVLTIGVSGGAAGALFDVYVLDTSGFTYTIKDAGGGTLWTHAANGVPTRYSVYNQTGASWAANTFSYING